MDEHIISLISTTIGLVSFSVSIVFFFLSSKAEKRNREIIDNINKAIQEWQNKIMASAIDMLESRPEIMGKRIVIEETKVKHDFLTNLSERIKYIIEHPVSGDGAMGQVATLKMLLDSFREATKSNIPPELYRDMMHQQIDNEQSKTKNNPNQPPNE